MPEKRLPMRRIREVLRLHFEAKLNERQIAKICSIGKGTVRRYLKRIAAAGLSWPLPAEIDDATLGAADVPAAAGGGAGSRPLPDFTVIHKELKSRQNVTLATRCGKNIIRPIRKLQLQLVLRIVPEMVAQFWTSYCARTPGWREDFRRSCRPDGAREQSQDGRGAGSPCLCGRAGGQAVTPTPRPPDAQPVGLVWISRTRLRVLSGHQPPDRAGQLEERREEKHAHEPELNRTYNDLAIHYGVGILPARPRRARDKAKAETGVQVVQRWVLAALRKRQFFSLAELNEAIAELVVTLNQRPFRKMPSSRAELYQAIDKPALQPLPVAPFVFAEWKKARVNLDYHVELEGHYYSTPYQLVGKEVEIHYTASTVEILYRGKRVASHAHSSKAHAHSTIAEHRPKSHQQYLEWTPTRMIEWAGKGGPFTARLVEGMLAEKPHPEMGYRSALGVISLSRKYGPERVEAACTRAVRLKIHRYQSVKSILAAGLDRQPLPQLVAPAPPLEHANIRGAEYYADGAKPAQEVGGC